MLYHPVRKRILQLVQSTLITRQILTHVRLVLVSSVWDHHLVLGPADSESHNTYMEGKIKGFFSYPLKPTFMSPLP